MHSKVTLLFLAVFLIVLLPQTVSASSVKVPILMYHFVANNPNPKDKQRDALSVSPDKFDEQMGYLSQNGYTPITLDTLYGIYNNQTSNPGKSIVLTFDDGYIDFYTTVYPILKKYNFHAVSFISTGLIGGGYYMSWDQIREIQSSGLVTFESHALSHNNLTKLSFAAILKELQDAKFLIYSQTNYPVNFIAYPYGASNGNIISASKKAGYVGGAGTWFGKAFGPSMNLPRIRVSGFWSLKEFASRI